MENIDWSLTKHLRIKHCVSLYKEETGCIDSKKKETGSIKLL